MMMIFWFLRENHHYTQTHKYKKNFYAVKLLRLSLHILTLTSRRQLQICCTAHVSSVTWYPAETIEIRLILSSCWNEQWQTVKKECRSQRGYQQMLVLSNLRSPDTGREKEREAKWLAGTLKRKWHLLPVSKKKTKRKVSYWKGLVADRPKANYSGWRRQKHILDMRDPSSSSQC